MEWEVSKFFLSGSELWRQMQMQMDRPRAAGAEAFALQLNPVHTTPTHHRGAGGAVGAVAAVAPTVLALPLLRAARILPGGLCCGAGAGGPGIARLVGPWVAGGAACEGTGGWGGADRWVSWEH